jgi:hypothetical protein
LAATACAPTGWRGSDTYGSWDVRQHVNHANLCALGNAWEACDARDEFGQFRPIGFDVRAAAGEVRRVSSSQLNLRSVPTTQGNTPIAQLPEGQLVRVLWQAAEPWMRIQTTLGGSDVIGYLTRVWWTDSALMRMAKGEVLTAVHGSTIREMRADDLHAWLIEFGPMFGWQRVFDATALQSAANGGSVGIVCADRDAEGKPGHISIVVPETDTRRAKRDADGHITLPLQSQAGAVNFRYSTGDRAW